MTERKLDPAFEAGVVVYRSDNVGIVELPDGAKFSFTDRDLFRNMTYHDNTLLGDRVWIRRDRSGVSAHPVYEPPTMDDIVREQAQQLSDEIDRHFAREIYKTVYGGE